MQSIVLPEETDTQEHELSPSSSSSLPLSLFDIFPMVFSVFTSTGASGPPAFHSVQISTWFGFIFKSIFISSLA